MMLKVSSVNYSTRPGFSPSFVGTCFFDFFLQTGYDAECTSGKSGVLRLHILFCEVYEMADQVNTGEYVTFIAYGGIPVTIVRYGGTFVRPVSYGGKRVTNVRYGGQQISIDREAELPEFVKEELVLCQSSCSYFNLRCLPL